MVVVWEERLRREQEREREQDGGEQEQGGSQPKEHECAYCHTRAQKAPIACRNVGKRARPVR